MNVPFNFTLRRGAVPVTLRADDPPAVEEGELLAFEVSLQEDADAFAWRIRLGDVLPDEPLGSDLGMMVRWKRKAWFDCCRGRVDVALERHSDPDAPPLSNEGWQTVAVSPVLVRPTKLTDSEWIAMRADLEAVAVDLVNDLVGKASAGLAKAIKARTALDHLVAARRLLARMDRALSAIEHQPHAVLRTTPDRSATPPRRLDNATLRGWLARGVDPRHRTTDAGARIVGRRPMPSTDVSEHREILGTIRAAARALIEGERRAKNEIAEITADRTWRQRSNDLPGASLYERFDQPRIDRLRQVLTDSAGLRKLAARLQRAPALIGLQGKEGGPTASLIYRHLPPYQLAFRAMLAWQTAGRVQVDVGDQIRRKDTDRMYEQWVFLQVAAALRALGYELQGAADIFQRMGERRYVVDLPRGARLVFGGPTGARLSLYFEPWIRPRESAVRVGDALFHGRGREAAWSPDVLLTVQTTTERHMRAVVIDAKYTRQVQAYHWTNVAKYLQIRRLPDGGNAVNQVWIAAPVSTGVSFEDDSIAWTSHGPDVPLDFRGLQGQIGLAPTLDRLRGEPVPFLLQFLSGLLEYEGVTTS